MADSGLCLCQGGFVADSGVEIDVFI